MHLFSFHSYHALLYHAQRGVAAGLAAIALLLLSTGCDSGQNPGARPGVPGGFSRGPTFVITELAAIREIRDQVEAIGTTRANESVTIAAKVTDTVSRVNFEDGQFVERGTVLVELTNNEQTALLDEAEANLMDARNQARRLEMLAAEGSVPLSQLDEAHARLSASQARYQSIVARLEDRLIHAPFSGLLGFREVSEGTLVTPGSPITTLDDISIIKLDFSIPEVYLNLVSEGLELIAVSSAFPDRQFEARVRTIGSRVDENTRAAMVRAHIDNPDFLLKPGMLLTVHLTTDVRQVLMVPETALMQRSSQVFVYTINDNEAEMLQIQTGVRRDGWIEVFSGLEENQNVITEGVIKVRDGASVTTELRNGDTGRVKR